jgi:GntR family transcriptional regulator / MocR family aminotransferase
MTRTRTSSALELLVPLSRSDPRPLHRQLEHELRDAIRSGRLAPASVLPSSRALAGQLGVSRGIVVEAYEQLVAEGYLASRAGGLTQVARAATVTTARPARPVPLRFVVDFRPGRPDVDQFPRAAWLRSFRKVLNETPSERFGYLDGRGTPELRGAVAHYLNRARGAAADPEDVVVCTGFAQGLRLAAGVLRADGLRRLAVEDPSDADYRAAARQAGLDVVGIPVDGAGLRVDRLVECDADAVLVTAAHQYPTGGVLPPERRAALVAWAARRSGVVIEDDYDAEFRYDREPIGAIQGLAPERVIYAGSASKVLAPGLRLGWLVAPSRLVPAIAAAKVTADLGSPAMDQLTFADFLARGELDHHLRRMRPIYRRRRDVLLNALDRHLPDVRPVGASAGLHVLAWLPPGLDEGSVVSAAAGAGIGLAGLAPRRIDPAGPGGLVFGYGAIVEEAIEGGVRRLADIVAEVRSSVS